jgi:hypothetical protein
LVLPKLISRPTFTLVALRLVEKLRFIIGNVSLRYLEFDDDAFVDPRAGLVDFGLGIYPCSIRVSSVANNYFLSSPRKLSISSWVSGVWRMISAAGMGHATIAPVGAESLTP